MRNILLLLTFFCLSAKGYCQQDEMKKWAIGLEYFNPIYLTGTYKFSNDDLMLNISGGPTADHERIYYKYAFGLTAKYYLNEYLSLKLWGGLSERLFNESYYDEFINTAGNPEIEKYSVSLEYRQTSWNTMVAVNFSERFKRIEINMGIELSYLRTGAGKQLYHNWRMKYENLSLPDSNDTYSEIIFSPGNSFGLGFYIGTDYHFAKRFSVGIEFHELAIYSLFNSTTTTESRLYSRNLGTPTTSSSSTTKDKENFKQFSYSTILPVFSVNYKF